MQKSYIEDHKRLIVQAHSFRDKDPDYCGWRFIDSLTERMKKNNREFTFKQQSALRKCICDLHWRSISGDLTK
jgi:hypothetical protein